MHALTFDSFGGPEVLSYRELPEPELPAGHIKLAMRAIGLNFADIYRRRGAYHLVGQPPYIAGYEGAGVVLALGADVNGIACGERYAFADVPLANASRVIVPFDHAIPLPDDITEVAAAAILLQGLTAQYLVEDSYSVQEHDWVLVHAAAGGVGQLLTQFATARGAQVIAMASSEAKRQIALQRGAVHALSYDADWPEQVRKLSQGGVHVAYDSVGTTLHDSLAAVRTRGTLVFFGMAGGDPKPVDPRVLMDASKRLVGADLWSYLDSREARLERAARLFDALRQGTIGLPTIETMPLSHGSDAHRRLEDRSFAGKIVMIPD